MNFGKMVLLVFLSCLMGISAKCQDIPVAVIGNWINQDSNDWEIGFYEQFAIYRKDFWEYQSVTKGKGTAIKVRLKKGKLTEEVTIQLSSDSVAAIKMGKSKAGLYTLMKKNYPTYKTKDTTLFKTPLFKQDSATIIGYYRNLDKVPQTYKERLNTSPVRVAVSNIITDEEEQFYTDIDSLGRFAITFPIVNMQELYFDWRRASLNIAIEAGDTILLMVDMNDYWGNLQTLEDVKEYYYRPKQIAFMGQNARLNNELAQFKNPVFEGYNRDEEVVKQSDMAFLKYFEGIYSSRLKELKQYAEKNNVSAKFRLFLQEKERYEFGSVLMQRRFDLMRREQKSFDKEYVDYVIKEFPLTNELVYTGVRDFGSFLRDYIEYMLLGKQDTVYREAFNLEEVLQSVKTDYETAGPLKEKIDTVLLLLKKADDDKSNLGVAMKLNALLEQEWLNNLMSTVVMDNFLLNQSVDALIANTNLRELYYTGQYYQHMEAAQQPLSQRLEKAFKEKVQNPYLRNVISTVNAFYAKVDNASMSYTASLKNTEHLKEYSDTKALWEELIKPYKGKVIYVDFWGTWCAPCLQNMPDAKKMKESMKDKEVVFMYLANSSPEKTWENVIKQMELTGENVVHYRLPDEQQAMLERMLSVTSFPTYILINKDGEIVSNNAKAPTEGSAAYGQIEALLQ